MKTQEEYVNRSQHCPFCDSENISGEEFDAEFDIVSNVVRCSDCEESWVDVYKLTGYERLNK